MTKSGKPIPLRGDVDPKEKDNVPQPVYGFSYKEVKAPSNRKPVHK
jgi:hypothetical protein